MLEAIRSQCRSRRGFTLVELLVVISILALLIAILLPSLTRARDQALSAKCLANLHSMGIGIMVYASEFQGTLPGPVHPAIKRKLFSIGTNKAINPEADRQKSLTYLLRQYLGTGGSASQQNEYVDKISSCPLADKLVPEKAFFDYQTGSCWDERPYSYVCNTWGPIMSPGSTASFATAEWHSTDPPHYFGAWFYCDNSPVRSDVSWRPKKIERIHFPGDEWAVGDAWYRRISRGSTKPGSKPKRQWLGTFAPQVSQNYKPIIPDRPYHGIRRNEVSSHKRADADVLPEIGFKGATNMVYFDGHAAPQHGQWQQKGEGGTVNPYWEPWGGKHPLNEPWYPE